MKRHVFSLLSAITLAFSLFLIPVRAIDTTTHTVSGRLLYEDGMTADYQLSMPHFLGALEIALPFYEDGTLVDRDCAVYVLCPPNGEDARMTVTLTDPTLTIYTSSQERTYLAYDGLRLAPVMTAISVSVPRMAPSFSFPRPGFMQDTFTSTIRRTAGLRVFY